MRLWEKTVSDSACGDPPQRRQGSTLRPAATQTLWYTAAFPREPLEDACPIMLTTGHRRVSLHAPHNLMWKFNGSHLFSYMNAGHGLLSHQVNKFDNCARHHLAIPSSSLSTGGLWPTPLLDLYRHRMSSRLLSKIDSIINSTLRPGLCGLPQYMHQIRGCLKPAVNLSGFPLLALPEHEMGSTPDQYLPRVLTTSRLYWTGSLLAGCRTRVRDQAQAS